MSLGIKNDLFKTSVQVSQRIKLKFLKFQFNYYPYQKEEELDE